MKFAVLNRTEFVIALATQGSWLQAWRSAFRVWLSFVILIITLWSIADSIDRAPTVAAGGTVERIPIGLGDIEKIGSRADGGWYLGIARNGYEELPYDEKTQHNWAFFPGYPLAIKAVNQVIERDRLAGIIVSASFALIAMVYLWKLTAETLDVESAHRTVLYLAIFPASFAFLSVLNIAMALCLMVVSFYYGTRRRWLLAGIAGAFATFTRADCLVITIPLLLIAIDANGGRRLRPLSLAREAWPLALVPVGLLVFMAHLWSLTGNPFAFSDIQVTWGREFTPFFMPLIDYVRWPTYVDHYGWSFSLVNFAASVLALVAGVVAWRRLGAAYGVLCLAAVILPLSTGSLMAVSRLTLMNFPLFILLAQMGRAQPVDRAVMLLSLPVLGLWTTLWATGDAVN